MDNVFNSIEEMISVLNTEELCQDYLKQLLWNNEPICPRCQSQNKNHYKILTRGVNKGRYKCKDCRSPFSITIGTIFEKSTIPLIKWFITIYIFSNEPKGINSNQLHKSIDVTQKTTWFILNRIRKSIIIDNVIDISISEELTSSYYNVSPKYYELYKNEFLYRYSIRHLSKGERFNTTIINGSNFSINC